MERQVADIEINERKSPRDGLVMFNVDLTVLVCNYGTMMGNDINLKLQRSKFLKRSQIPPIREDLQKQKTTEVKKLVHLH